MFSSKINIFDSSKFSFPVLKEKIIFSEIKSIISINSYGKRCIFLKIKKTGFTYTAMRHGLRTKRLGRSSDQRKALIRCLVTDVLTHGKIKTSMVRAKYVRKYVDRMITLSKNGSLHARRQMESFIYNKKLVKTIIEEAPKRYEKREGGYCRVTLEIETRKGDAAKLAYIELV